MTQEFGRVERPPAGAFRWKRKLFLVPRLYEPPTGAEQGLAILMRYWDQMQAQVSSLESRLGGAKHIYHESLTEGGERGLSHLETLDRRSHAFVEAKYQTGAILETTEDEEVLGEILDLQRCLMLPFTSNQVASRLHDWFTEAVRRRYEHISKQIDDTLGEDEVGLLVINERHQIQFPSDVEVFFVAPPALDEFRRWLDGWIAQQQSLDTEGGQTRDSSGETEMG